MNATKELIEATEYLLSQFGKQDHLCDYGARPRAEAAIAAAKEEQERKVLTDEGAERIAYNFYLSGGASPIDGCLPRFVIWLRDNGYLSPAPFDVEGAINAVRGEVLDMLASVYDTDTSELPGTWWWTGFLKKVRKALEAYAEKGGGNLRKDGV